LPVPMLWLLLLLLVSFVCDVTSNALIFLAGAKNNMVVINTYILLILPSTLPFFYSIYQNKNIRRICVVVFILTFITVAISSTLIKYSLDFHSLGASVATFGTMIACLLYLTDLAIYSNVSDLSKDSYIYVVTALLVSNAALITHFMSYHTIGQEAHNVLWSVKHFSMIIFHFCIAYTAFTKYKQHRELT